MNIIGRRKIFYTISGAFVLASFGALFWWGLVAGIDFTGGSILEVTFSGARPDGDALRARLASLDLGSVIIQPSGEHGMLIRFQHVNEEKHQAVLASLQALSGEKNVTEQRFSTIGPTIGRELYRRSIFAVLLVIVLIVIYIAWAFRKVSAPVQSWKYGITTIIALVHDVIIPVGFFALAGHFFGYEVDTLFVTAVLTILGFSVHDTIVVFDRIRENLGKRGNTSDFAGLVNQSVSETFGRSINTSLTVVLALLGVYLFGGASTRVFSLTLMIGIAAGTYSSIFIASPLLVTWQEWKKRASLSSSM